MIHIFKGSIHKRYYQLKEGYYFNEKPYLIELSAPVEWKTIQTNNKIGFPLKSGDYVNVNNERLYIFSTVIHDDGSIVCQTSNIIDILPNEKDKKYYEDKIASINNENEKEIVGLSKQSWIKRLFQ